MGAVNGGRWRVGVGLELAGYQRPWLRGDVLAGVTVAAYLVPQVMAYARLAGLPAQAGLWAAACSLLVYAVLGSSRQLSVGPESTTALLTAAAVAPLAGGDPSRYAALAAGLALLVGGICLLASITRLGTLAELLSKPVLVGYLLGVSVIMIMGQLDNVTGVTVDGDSLLDQLRSFIENIRELEPATTVLSTAVLALLLLVGRRWPRAPGPLIAILLATAAVALLDLRDEGVGVVGSLPGGFPRPEVPALSGADFAALLLPAVGVTIVGYTDNVLTGRAFAARRQQAVDGNQELLALGAANAVSALFRGFPVSSSGSRTAIGAAVGSRTQVHSIVAVGTVVLALLVARPMLERFPTPALGAIVIWAALLLVDLPELRRIARFRRTELVIALATAVAVAAVDILYGILIAVGLSALDLLRRVARPPDGVLGYAPGVAGMHDIADYAKARQVPGLVVYRYDSPLFFANAHDFTSRALRAVDRAEAPVEWFVLNAEAIVEIDLTAVDALEELREELDRRGVVFAMARVKQDLRDDLARAGLLERVGTDHVFMTLPEAVGGYVRWYIASHGAPPPGVVMPRPSQSPIDPG